MAVTGRDSSGYPQTSANRTREAASIEIAEFHGGSDQKVVQERAGRSWDSAVREMNAYRWKFNRVVEDIDLSSPVAAATAVGIVANTEYALSNNFKSPKRAVLVDSSSKPRDSIHWVNYPEFLTFSPDQSYTGSRPLYYTARNIHQNGRIIVNPPLDTSNLTWPTLRLVYLRPIELALGLKSKLDVPVEVDEAIFQLAVAHYIQRQEGFEKGNAALAAARIYIKGDMAPIWMDYDDIEVY